MHRFSLSMATMIALLGAACVESPIDSQDGFTDWVNRLSPDARLDVADVVWSTVRDLDSLGVGAPVEDVDEVIDDQVEALDELGAPKDDEAPHPDDEAPVDDPCQAGLDRARSAFDLASMQLEASSMALRRAGSGADPELSDARHASERSVRFAVEVVREAEQGLTTQVLEGTDLGRKQTATDAAEATRMAALAMSHNLAAYLVAGLTESYQAHQAGQLAHDEMALAAEALQACAE